MKYEFYQDPEIFPERLEESGITYVEAEDKETIEITPDVRFVKAKEVSSIVYESKSGQTKLIWNRIEGDIGKLKGKASLNSVVNLVSNHVLDESYIIKDVKSK
ncbi:hypothetical protein [[Eubacterium] cellulosolvens]